MRISAELIEHVAAKALTDKRLAHLVRSPSVAPPADNTTSSHVVGGGFPFPTYTGVQSGDAPCPMQIPPQVRAGRTS